MLNNKHLSVVNIINLGFRISSIGSKFLFIVFLGKYYSPEIVGMYGLVNTSIILAFMLLGFDFYSFSTRELIQSDGPRKGFVLYNQMIFTILSYFLLFPVIYLLVFQNNVLPIKYLLPFILLLLNEYLGQEIYRLLTTIQKPLFANVALFIRSGSWVLIYFVFTKVLGRPINDASLIDYLYFWTIAGGISNLASFVIIVRQFEWSKASFQFDKAWIIKGLFVSSWFFASTIAYKIIEFSNRYIIDYYHGKEEVGYFTFFNQMANLINVVVFTVVIMNLYPVLLHKRAENNSNEFQDAYKVMKRRVWVWSLLSSVVVLVSIFPILTFLAKDKYLDNINTFYLLVLGNILLNFSLVPHYALYALKEDKALFVATLFGAIANLTLNFVFIPLYGAIGAGIAIAFSYGIIWLWKTYSYKVNSCTVI